MILATLHPHEVPNVGRILAGHRTDDSLTVYVLRRYGDEYHLHELPVDKAQEMLRAFLSVDQAAANEITRCILQTQQRAAQKPRRKGKAR